MGLFRSNTDMTSPLPGMDTDDANEQLNVNGVGDPTVVLAVVGLNGLPPTQYSHKQTPSPTH